MVLEVNDLTFNYETKKIFNNLYFDVQKGETVTILGINGVGKSTLIRCLLGLLDFESGSVKYDRKALDDITTKARAKYIGYVPQKETNPFAFSVEEIVLMGRNGHISLFAKPKKADLDAAYEAMDIVGVTHLRDRIYNELSGGEMQLVMVARALATFPKLLIMDEPISHLDVGKQNEMLKLISKLNKEYGISVLMTSHYPDHALAISHRTLLLKGEAGSDFGETKEMMSSENLFELFGVSFASITLGEKHRTVPKWQV
jgi:iron complex transport system ATP-binding protein